MLMKIRALNNSTNKSLLKSLTWLSLVILFISLAEGLNMRKVPLSSPNIFTVNSGVLCFKDGANLIFSTVSTLCIMSSW